MSKGVADRGAKRSSQFLAAQDRNTRERVLATGRKGRGDYDVVVIMGVILVLIGRGFLGLGRQRGNQRKQARGNKQS